MGAYVFLDHMLKVFLFPQLFEGDQVLRHIAAVLEAGIPGMGIQQLLPMLGAGIFSTFAAKRQAFFFITADPEFTAPFTYSFL